MADRTLFGVAVPDGAVRVAIRPILGRGGALPLYEARLDEGLPSDADVVVAASKNQGFWDYVDAQIKKKRITASDADCEWKLRVQFFDQQGIEAAHTTDGAFEFYRSISASKSADETPEARAFERSVLLLERLTQSTEKANKRIAKSTAKALEGMTAALTGAIAQVSTAASNAQAEASKQLAVVTEITKALHQEALDLKEGIFELQTERAKTPAAPPQTMAQQIKEVVEVGRTVMGFAEGLSGGSSAAAAPAPTPAPAPAPSTASTAGET